MELLLLTADPVPDSVLPALSVLAHSMRSAAPEVVALLQQSLAEEQGAEQKLRKIAGALIETAPNGI